MSACTLKAVQEPQLPGLQVQARHGLLHLRQRAGTGQASMAHLRLLTETVSCA